MKVIRGLYAGIVRSISFFRKWYYLLFYNSLSNNRVILYGQIKNSRIHIRGINNLVFIRKGSKLSNVKISISGNNSKIFISDDVVFREGGYIRIEGFHNQLVIGPKTNLVNVFFSMGDSDTSVFIGNNCLISANVIFRSWDNHSIFNINNLNKRINGGKNIRLDDHVWIGYGVTILKGSTIGHDSVIGTMSLVNKSIPSNSIAVGVPARVVKQNITWDEQWL